MWVRTGISDQIQVWLLWTWLYTPRCLCPFNATCVPLLSPFKMKIKLNWNFPGWCSSLFPLDLPEPRLGEQRVCFLWLSGTSLPIEQWKPLDPERKKQYDREFLLDIQFMPACIQKPEGLPPISDVVLDKVRGEPIKQVRAGFWYK